MNAKELAQDVYDSILRAFEGDTDRDLDGDDFDTAQDAAEEAINDATQATDEAEDEDDEAEADGGNQGYSDPEQGSDR